MNAARSRPPLLHRRVLSLFDALAEEPVWRRSLIAYLFASACLWTASGLVHHDHGVAALVYAPVFAVPFLVAAHAVTSVVREVLNTPAYFAALAGVLLAASRLTPGKPVSFRQLFSVTVHAGYVLLVGHALRVALAAGGVGLTGPALLPDPDAMFLSDPARPGVVNGTMIAFSVFSRSPADVLSTGVLEVAFHALLGVAYCRIRGGKRLIVGAAWGGGLSLLVDIVWLLLGAES